MAKVRGHRMAKAAIENAAWDAEARQKQQPLWKLLGGTTREIQCGVSIGIQDSVEQLLDKIETELAAGYRRIKVKVKPGWDVDVLERIRARWPDILLSCDANSAYTLDEVEHLRKFDRFNLLMIEQPLWNDDIYYHARLQRELQTAICLDESIRHARDAAAAVETGACRIVNIKVGRVGGFSEARKVHDVCQDNNVPVWCGGMLESGVGRAHNIALSTLPEFPPARRRVRVEALLEGRHHRARGRSQRPGNDHGQRPARHRLPHSRRLDRKAGSKKRNVQTHVAPASDAHGGGRPPDVGSYLISDCQILDFRSKPKSSSESATKSQI